MRKRSNDPLAGAPAAGVDGQRGCDVEGCEQPGGHRAPRSRDALREYYWFCLDHVREYNRSWDYFAGMGPDEIEAIRQDDTIWNRPTWPLGWADWRRTAYVSEAELRAALQSLRAERRRSKRRSERKRERPRLAEAAQRALDVFDLDLPVTRDRIKARYKELVKRYHPDANGGDRAAEERLKEINGAYRTLTQTVIS